MVNLQLLTGAARAKSASNQPGEPCRAAAGRVTTTTIKQPDRISWA